MVGRRLVPELHRRGPLAPPDRPRHALAARPARADGRVRRPGAGPRRGPAFGVHPERAAALDIEDVARIYLRKRRFWGDGTPIVALNREPGTVARVAFSHGVLHADPPRLQAYWDQQYFAGIFPPSVLSSGAAVKRYVAADRAAIGY